MRQETIIENQAEQIMEQGNLIDDMKFEKDSAIDDFQHFFEKVKDLYMDFSGGEIGSHTMNKKLREALFSYEYQALNGIQYDD